MHGMDALGRVLATIERHESVPVTAIDVRFKRPIALPATVELAWRHEGRFVVDAEDGGTRHLEGTFRLG
jgi:hypothetical protein